MPDDEDGRIDWDEAVAMYDDALWSAIAFRIPFRWQLFLDWWVARRWIEPRDVRRR